MAVMAPLFLLISAEAPFKTLPELIAHGKSQPNGLTFASPGAGSQPHLAAELLFKDAAVKGLNVPFRGDSMAYTELLAGRVDATITAISTALPHVQSGKFRVLGRGRRRAQFDLPAGADLARAGPAQRGRCRLVRLHGPGRHAAPDRRPVSGRDHSCAGRSAR